MTVNPVDDAKNDELERAIAKYASWGLPAGTVAVSIVIGQLFSVGPAILALAAGGLVGVIALLWASLRTLGGDAPLAEGLAEAAAMRGSGVRERDEQKRRVLRALKDLEHEHAIGKIDDADYAKISARYREQAKLILREQDVEVQPLRARAEALADAHLKKKGLAIGGAPATESAEPVESSPELAEKKPARLPCAKCATSNEPDAAFCKKCGERLQPAAEAVDATA